MEWIISHFVQLQLFPRYLLGIYLCDHMFALLKAALTRHSTLKHTTLTNSSYTLKQHIQYSGCVRCNRWKNEFTYLYNCLALEYCVIYYILFPSKWPPSWFIHWQILWGRESLRSFKQRSLSKERSAIRIEFSSICSVIYLPEYFSKLIP